MIAFCERYRAAVESSDIDALIAMASPKYKDEDVDYTTLASFLRRSFANVDAIRYDFLYRRVWFEGNRVSVEYTYSASYRSGKERKHVVNDNRLVLEQDGDAFRILSGM